MQRSIWLWVGAVSLLVCAVVAWSAVGRERAFRRLIAEGDQALARNDTVLAIEAFSGALALKRDSMVAHLKRGDSYRRRGELAAALRDLREAATLDPTAPQPAELLGDVNLAMQRYDHAVSDYRRFIALDERSPRVLYKLALAYHQQGDSLQAIDPLRRAVAMDEQLVEAHYLLGLCLRARQRTGEAVRMLRRAIEIDPAFTPAREELADVYLSLGRHRERIEQLEALAALEPAKTERIVSLAAAYVRMKRSDAAIAALGRAAERAPDDPAIAAARARIWLADAEAENDRLALAKAVDTLGPAALQPSATGETLTVYGRAQLLSGDVAGAEVTLQRAAARLPVQPVAFLLLATAAQRLDHLALARDSLVRYAAVADTADYGGSTLATRIASLSLRLDDAATAERWLRRAGDNATLGVDAMTTLADAQLRLGELDAAGRTIAQALERDPKSARLLALQRQVSRRP